MFGGRLRAFGGGFRMTLIWVFTEAADERRDDLDIVNIECAAGG